MVKRTDSLLFRILMLTLFSIVFCITVVGGLGIYAIKQEGDRDTSRQMNLICDDRSKSLNEFLKSVEQSAGMVARFAVDDLNGIALIEGGVIGADGLSDFTPHPHSADGAAYLETHLREHADRVLSVFRSSASHTQGIYSFYYRVNPQLSQDPIGFWYTRTGDTAFTPHAMTDLSRYAEEDETYVSWYYKPVRNGHHTWMLPYYFEPLQTTLLSYIIPIYKAGTFLGLVGIDIRFETLTEQVNNTRVFDSGYAYLALESGELVYHPGMEVPDHTELFDSDKTPVARYFQQMDGSGEMTIPYRYRGEDKEMAFNTLANGMKLVVVAPSREINASWHSLIAKMVLFGISVTAVFGIAMGFTLQQIINPLRRLTEASRKLADGNYDVELNYNRPDEVGVLTEAFRKLTAHLKIYISDLNSRAYRDALTGVRNKGAFSISAKKLDDAIRQGKQAPFAIVMFDCDNLKTINDDFGHEKGDTYLQNACRLICRVFSHSPVFRIGGDEFAAILLNEDYIHREQLMQEFDSRVAGFNAMCSEPWAKVSVSKGLASFDPKLDVSCESVLNRADSSMYRTKKDRKSAAEN